MAFDVHLADTFVSLSLGMTLVCAPRTQLFEELPKWIHTMRITHIGIVPSLIEATLVAVSDTANGDITLQTMDLAYIASGGEKMSDTVSESPFL